MTATTFTVVVPGTYGPSTTTVPTVPTLKFASMGQYQLGAYASRPEQYPDAVVALNAKRAKEQQAEERETARASKPKGGKGKPKFVADNGTSAPGAVDGPKANTPPATTDYATTLRTASPDQLMDALMDTCTTLTVCGLVLDTLSQRILAKVESLKASKASKPAPTTPPAPKMAAQTPPAAKLEPVAAPAPTTPPAPPVADKYPGIKGYQQLAREVKAHEGLATTPKGTKEALLARLAKPAKVKATKSENEAKGKTPTELPAAPIAAKLETVTHYPAGTVLLADGKGGFNVLTLEDMWSLCDKMTAGK